MTVTFQRSEPHDVLVVKVASLNTTSIRIMASTVNRWRS